MLLWARTSGSHVQEGEENVGAVPISTRLAHDAAGRHELVVRMRLTAAADAAAAGSLIKVEAAATPCSV